ncbi:DUF3800 domain-containing protein [Proteiniborus sp. MB09-C3]|uniref:DUF3800 domain-containing protein n=1 Tax=Proteiniborus sp. MB09-C3 TaxID=3050072 RepID=UPI0025556268|nr:DUF3800 domain-containing protein [Proteiniborus sp. MB09-C3]WIV10532.1 DUF3800 domain-containing protein [Proteiniborus sp. MB09-C3]
MGTYYLFLDELKPNSEYKHFCLGGCIIEEMTYKNEVIPYVNNLKQNVFGNTTIILHENKIRQRKNNDGYNYGILKDKAKETQFWEQMRSLFSKSWIKTICVGIDYDKYRQAYKKSSLKNSEYFIALQIILENFIHFLLINNSKGAVYIESRGIDDDQYLEIQYNIIKNNGTLFVERDEFQKRLKTISFPMKADNNIGIQIADFVPNPVARHFDGTTQRPLTIFDEIRCCSYDGDLSLIDRFGLKKVL